MIIHAVLGNPNHPEYGVATIPFPIPHDQYAHCMGLLEALEIGDAVKADCQVQEINSFYSALKRTEMLPVNVEKLNYLLPSGWIVSMSEKLLSFRQWHTSWSFPS